MSDSKAENKDGEKVGRLLGETSWGSNTSQMKAEYACDR